MTMRIGHGYDAHRLAAGRALIIGGVKIPHDKGLLGHSDADVLLHAVMDAMLGAVAHGDIGVLFPDSDPAYENADSLKMLREVKKIIAEKGFALINIDATVIAQKPKLMPYIPKMRDRIAAALEADVSCVGVKATTEEGLGFTGSLDGIAAHAVVLLEKT